MRRSPGKWLKTLFGKKSSPSSSTKSKKLSEKGLTQGYEAPLGDNSPIISEPVLVSTYSNTNLPIVEETYFSDMHGCETTLPVISQSTLETVPIHIDQSRGCNKLCEEKAATKAQAAIRGFLARRKFQALKGIVRLQALIRGHLVRRQAVATLYAMYAIVRLQVIVRGRIARHSDISRPMNYAKKQHDVMSCTSGNAWKKNFQDNALGHQLLSSRVVFKPLLVQFEKEDPNSVSSWLERWNLTHFWKPVVKANHAIHSKTQQRKSKKFSANQPLKTNPKLTKHQASQSEPEKRKDNLHSQTPQVPKTKIEKSKRVLRKVSNSKSDAEIGKLSSGSKKSQSKAVGEVSKISETASETVDAKPSEAKLSLSGDEESIKVIYKRSSLSTPVEVAEKELDVEVTTSEGKSLSGNREAGSKSNSRRSSLSTTRLEIPEKELHSTVSSSEARTLLDRNASEEKSFSSTRDSSNKLNNKRRSLSDASKTMPEGKPSEEKPLSSSGNSGNKLNSRRRSSLSDASKTMRDGKLSEEKPLSSGGDSADNSGNKLNSRRRSSLSDASKTMPDGKPSEEKPLSSSGDSADKSNNRRRSSLSTTRLEISENELNVSVNKSASKIMTDVNSSEEKSLSSNGEPANSSNNRRRSSFTAGIEIPETELHSSTLKSVPSYMATTESAKARLRGQSSPRVVTTPDTADKNGPMRRHSLPSGSANGKLKSISPRTQKPVHSGGSKGLIKGERSLNLSRDGSATENVSAFATEKSIHTEWRRW